MNTVITCTQGKRMLHKTAQMIEHQTLKPDLWVVVSDIPQTIELSCCVTECYSMYGVTGRNPNTLNENLIMGLLQSYREPRDCIFFFEDDDYYGPKYIESIVQFEHSIVGVRGRYIDPVRKLGAFAESVPLSHMRIRGREVCKVLTLAAEANHCRVNLDRIMKPVLTLPQGQLYGIKNASKLPLMGWTRENYEAIIHDCES